MKKMKQLPSADVHHLMLVFVDAVTERAVVILEINGSLRVGMLHWAKDLEDSNRACGDLDRRRPPALGSSLELGHRNGGRDRSELRSQLLKPPDTVLRSTFLSHPLISAS